MVIWSPGLCKSLRWNRLCPSVCFQKLLEARGYRLANFVNRPGSKCDSKRHPCRGRRLRGGFQNAGDVEGLRPAGYPHLVSASQGFIFCDPGLASRRMSVALPYVAPQTCFGVLNMPHPALPRTVAVEEYGGT